MGCDGGTVPKKRKLIVKKKKNKKFSQPKTISSSIYWEMCRYTKQPLRSPLCVDKYGFLYNKKQIILALFSKEFKKNELLKKDFGHIKSLKDVQDVKFSTRKNSEIPNDWICPLIDKGVRGPFQFILFRSCGHVVSKQGYEEVVKQSGNCCVCNERIQGIVILNNDQIEIEKMKKKNEMEEEIAKRMKKKKKKKKRKKKNISDTPNVKIIGKKRTRDTFEEKKSNGYENGKEHSKKKVKLLHDIPENIRNQIFVNSNIDKIKMQSDSSKFMNRSHI